MAKHSLIENVTQTIADFDEIQDAINEQHGYNIVPDGMPTSEYAEKILDIVTASDITVENGESEVGKYISSIQKVDSPTSSKLVIGKTNFNDISLNASVIKSGTIDIERLPKGALERLIIVSTKTDALNNKDITAGDTVKITGENNQMYYCKSDTGTFEERFEVYTAGTATSVPWSGVTGKPSTYPSSPHTHSISDITNLNNTLDTKLNVNGSNATEDGVSTLIDQLRVDGGDLVDTDLWIGSLAGEFDLHHFYKHRVSKIWEYIQNKTDAKYSLLTHKHTSADVTDLTAKLDTKLNISGNNGTANGVSALMNKLNIGTSVPKDDDYYICQWANGGTTTTSYHRRAVKYLWEYIKSKANSVYAAKTHTHRYSDITNTYLYISAKGANLNDYRNVGYDYYCPMTSIAQTLLNCPTNVAFTMHVSINSNGVQQRLVEYTTKNPKIFYRNLYDYNQSNSNWSPWFQEYTSSNPIPLNAVDNDWSKVSIKDNRSVTNPTPATFSPRTASFWFTDRNVPTNSWYSGITMKGWANSYSSWQLCAISTEGVIETDSNLYFRLGNNATWENWRALAFKSEVQTLESNSFVKNRGDIPIAFADLTNYSAGDSNYKNYAPGTYSIPYTGASQLFINFPGLGSASGLQLRTSYVYDDDLKFRKTVDSNRIDGQWRSILTNVNIGKFALTPSNYGNTLNSKYVKKNGDAMTGPLTVVSNSTAERNNTLTLKCADGGGKNLGVGIKFNSGQDGQQVILRHEYYDTFRPGYGLAISKSDSLEAGDPSMFLYNTGKYISKVPTGTAPIEVDSTTVCTNLNADLLDGRDSLGFVKAIYGNENNANPNSMDDMWSKRTTIGSVFPQTGYPGENGWYNVIQLAHRNGEGDGVNYVGQIALNMTPANHDKMWIRSNVNNDWVKVLTENENDHRENDGHNNYVKIRVEGDGNTYYPVLIKVGDERWFEASLLSISRQYDAQAPGSIWNPNQPTHPGGLTCTFLMNGSKYWDGNGSGSTNYYNLIYFNETYSRMVAKFQSSTQGFVVWLRGGGADYWIHSNRGVGLKTSVSLTKWTDSAGSEFGPLTAIDEANIESYRKLFVRSTTAEGLYTPRTLTIGNTGKTFSGRSNVSWSLSEIGAAASSHNHSWANITSGKPTTLSGYGITDAYTKTESNNKYLHLADTLLDFNSNNLKINLYNYSNDTLNKPNNFGTLLNIANVNSPVPGGAQNWIYQLAFGTDLRMYLRNSINDVPWTSWKTLAFTSDNVASATKLAKSRTINGTSFDGTANITTANWGNYRQITIGKTIKSVNGSTNVAWTLDEIGAAPSLHTHNYAGSSSAGGAANAVTLDAIKNAWNGHDLLLNNTSASTYLSFGANGDTYIGYTNVGGGLIHLADTNEDVIFQANLNGVIIGSNAEIDLSTSGVGIFSDRVNAVNGFYETSDERLKNFQDDVNVDLNELSQIPVKHFTWKKDVENPKQMIGTSAQEVQKLYPELVSENEDGELSVDYAKFSMICLSAIKQLKNEIDELKKLIK